MIYNFCSHGLFPHQKEENSMGFEDRGGGFRGGFALVIVLFILLIIIGCSCWGGGYGGGYGYGYGCC